MVYTVLLSGQETSSVPAAAAAACLYCLPPREIISHSKSPACVVSGIHAHGREGQGKVFLFYHTLNLFATPQQLSRLMFVGHVSTADHFCFVTSI